jgi:hypothetical protein
MCSPIIFIFYSRLEGKRFYTEWQEAFSISSLLLISSWTQYWFGRGVPKYLNCSAPSEELLHVFMLWFCPAVFSRDVKRKGFPLQAWSGSWGSRRLRLLDLLDFRHYEGGKVVTLTDRLSLPPGLFLVHIFRGWVDPRAYGSVGSLEKNPQRHHWESIPRHSE